MNNESRPTLVAIREWWRAHPTNHSMAMLTQADFDKLDALIRADERAKLMKDVSDARGAMIAAAIKYAELCRDRPDSTGLEAARSAVNEAADALAFAGARQIKAIHTSFRTWADGHGAAT